MRPGLQTAETLEQYLAAEMRGTLCPDASTETNLAKAIEHTLRHPGNLVRARTSYLLCRGYGLESAALGVALAVELFHSASLLFDDLPCMDNAEERRGVPCTHRKYGEPAAILAALAMINKAYELLWKAMQDRPEEVRREAGTFVEQCLGLNGIINGQSCDLHFTSGRRSGGQVMRIAMGKTVSMIKMSLVLPGILGMAPKQELRLLNRLSLFWGLAYQVLDDLKDILAASDRTGKTTQRDGLLGRPNLALAEGPLRTGKLLGRLVSLGDQTLEQISEPSAKWDCLKELRSKLAGEFSLFQRTTANSWTCSSSS